ncbi:fimbrial protein [Pseudomonas soli]|uniref:fimbrial protein n=1 Tax=Pseudomonas soli TaxID=1306993 RepID=UPI003802D679
MNHGTFPFAKAASGLGLAFLCVVAGQAHASCTSSGLHYITYNGPGTITLPRDAPDDTVLYTETRTLPYTSFSCSTSELWGLKLAAGRGAAPVTQTTVFPIGTSGLAFRIKAGLASGVGYLGSLSQLAAGSYKLEGSIVLEVVKAGALAPSNQVKSGALGTVLFGTETFINLSLSKAINVVAASCETPDVNVPMGDDYKLADFGGPGTTSRAVPFNIRLDNCPKGIAKVRYQLQALTPVINAGQGVVGLNSTSSAVGIGLQIKDDNGVPVPLNTSRTFSGYNVNGGNFVIPLTASYYRLASESLRPGSANSEVTFIMSYL